ncbi:CBS domain-containing protein [Vibrio mimicus]|uniref:CBS domain-containing protein n=1 Tax=Vibrio mimicus TaxID=674 RepID=UPI0011D8DB7E|nr:cyclic nucleotide-binding/CBS domain-containing protein [Vibrio mimicus]TXY05164.1 cyclic nucleotide-binding/CBS domain-containing protein [Vibrio mimicus]
MPDKFNMQSPPFNRLTVEQQHQLRSALDVAYFRQRDVLIDSKQPTTHLHILIKGTVEERSPDGKEVFAHYANDDLFDVRAMFDEHSKHQYIALEDTLSYLLPKQTFLALYHQNGEFAAYFDNNLAKRQELIEAASQQKNIAEFILTKVDSSIYHPPFIISPEQPLNSVTQLMKERGIDAALVALNQDDPRLESTRAHPYAIITRTNMLHAVMLESRPLDTPVGEIATFPVLHVDEGDFLFNAMVMMTRQRIKRVMVCNGNQAVGLLSMIQILSAFSTHSHVLTLAIARATSVDELALAANKQRELVENLMLRGVRTRFVMELISAVNEQIIEKAFELVVPPALHDQCCLVVLGSEGRGEQILKTDQDNALIIQDGLEWHQCQPIMETLTHTLFQLGYPLCPGKVMVNNPKWVRSQSEWKRTLSDWVKAARSEQVMDIAIFADAHAVAGNRSLLAPVKAHLRQLMADQELILTEFTRPALSFSVPLTLFGNVKSSKQGIDIKQGGIFPIVHGVRALSLEHAIEANNTFDRIEALVQKRVLEQETGDNLSEAFKLFLKLRLAQQLGNQHSTNQIDFKQLDRTERDLLRHSLHVVKKFKQWLGYHYQIRD